MPELQESSDIIADGIQYALLSNDNGKSYLLRYKEERQSCLIEGDEASSFIQEYESVKTQYPGYDTDQILAQLWDQGGYSWMAVSDEE